MAHDTCYYATPDFEGDLWTCQSCGEQFCQTHWHQTDKGTNVECVACERVRREQQAQA